MYEVKQITREETKDYILNIHYAKRFPSVSFAFGLFLCGDLVGVVTYGTPASATLKTGIAGAEMACHVLELNRLVLRHNLKNEASMLVGKSLSMLPKGKIIVSFADCAQNHVGTVYQAANFGYYGLSAKRTDWRVRGKEHLHGQTIADEFRGLPNRAQHMREKYGSDFYLEPRSRKHRYIYVTGNQKSRDRITKLLKYKREAYVKNHTPLES